MSEPSPKKELTQEQRTLIKEGFTAFGYLLATVHWYTHHGVPRETMKRMLQLLADAL